jgi:hypothetical protein
MRYYFWAGVIAFYVAFILLTWEICFEPELLKRPGWIQVALIGVALALFDLFTIGIVCARAPLEFFSYSMRKGDYAAGTIIGSITWDRHFTDLRVAITNLSGDDYGDFDVTLCPDEWTHKAAILDNASTCALNPVDGGTFVSFARAAKHGELAWKGMRVPGGGFVVNDSMGNAYTPLATRDGYRLRCGKLPAHSTVKIVFAVVSLGPSLLPARIPRTWGGLNEGQVSDPFDLLDSRPAPSKIVVKGTYTRTMKPFSVMENIVVVDGN